MSDHELFSGKLLPFSCPWCKIGKKVIRQNRETREFFTSCTRWPECKFSENLPEDMRLRALGQKGLFDR